MTVPSSEMIVVIAFAHTAEIQAWAFTATSEEREVLEHLLSNLFDLGQVARYSITLNVRTSFVELLSGLRSRLGDLTTDACLSAPPGRPASAPWFLMPVWAFEDKVEGTPVAIGRLLGLDLELTATPSPDEELGAHLPGRVGRWLIRAEPLVT